MQKLIGLLIAIGYYSTTLGQIVDYNLSKKQFGTYLGVLDSYLVNDGNNVFSVEESPLIVQLTANDLKLKIGNKTYEGEYTVLFSTKKYSVLEVQYPGIPTRDRYMIQKNGKTLTRDALQPQPQVECLKLSKKKAKTIKLMED